MTRDQFFKNVQKVDSGCWNWKGRKSYDGYGLLWLDGKNFRAHRAAWIIRNGKIPRDLLVLHKCDNRSCVRPDHLFLGTYDDNNKDKVSKSRQARGLSLPHTKLRPNEVIEIRKLFSSGTSRQIIAKTFGVDTATVSNIMSVKTWKYI